MPPVMMPPPASNARLERLCTHLVPDRSTADVSTEPTAGVVRWLRSLFDGGGGGATDGEQGGTGRVALGTVQLGMAYGAGNTTGLPSVAEATEIVHLAIESGISVLDTAYGYGLSEERIGQALKELPPELTRPWVVTKVNAACGDAETGAAAREIVQQSLATSRERLQVESLDTVLLHHFKMYQNNDGAAWQALVEARERGETQKIGVSTYEPEEVMEALADPDMQHIQLPFNLLAAEWKTDEFASAVAARPDVTIHVRSIYLQGLLVADRTRWPTFSVESGLADRVIAALDQLVLDLQRKDRLDLSLAYARGVPWISEVVLGAETAEQVRDNVVACDTPALTADEIKVVDDVVDGLEIPELLLHPGDWIGAVGFSNGQAAPAEGDDEDGEEQ